MSLLLALSLLLAAAPDTARYVPKPEDPTLKALEQANEGADQERDEQTRLIRARQKSEATARQQAATVLQASPPAGLLPTEVGQFKTVWHQPPVAQYLTGTCWAFAGTSLVEAEVARQTGRRVKLAEMHTVYFEYIEKARAWVATRGASLFAEGSQPNAVTRIMALHGAVPAAIYPGVLDDHGQHNHALLVRELRHYLAYVKERDVWDEGLVLLGVSAILDRWLGPPPLTFEWEGKRYTPLSFLKDHLRLDPRAFVAVQSVSKQPFWQLGELEVPDNWWHDASYLNVPLDDFSRLVDGAFERGFSLALGGDVSEPGKLRAESIAFVPSFDIPVELIDQTARQLRIDGGATGDDHGVHLVGRAVLDGWTWYLVKDSGRSARHERPEGYYFFRQDYVRLKMLSVMIHRDAARELLERARSPAEAAGGPSAEATPRAAPAGQP